MSLGPGCEPCIFALTTSGLAYASSTHELSKEGVVMIHTGVDLSTFFYVRFTKRATRVCRAALILILDLIRSPLHKEHKLYTKIKPLKDHEKECSSRILPEIPRIESAPSRALSRQS